METIKIQSISNFLSQIETIKRKQCNAMKLYFRGQSAYLTDAGATMLPIPSILRDDSVRWEDEIYQKALRIHPEIFRECHTFEEQLTTMQHFGLPTRALDITFSPLVALYFACSNDKDKDGVVYFRYVYKSQFNDDNFTAAYWQIIQYLLAYNNKSFALQELVTILQLDKKKILSLFACLAYPQLVMPTIVNERIRAQDGAFLLFGFHPVDVERYNEIANQIYDLEGKARQGDIDTGLIDALYPLVLQQQFENYNTENIKDVVCAYGMSDTVFIIPHEKKEELLDELDTLAVNEGVLFPDPEHQMKTIKRRFERNTGIKMNL